jgi:hypothetical protein
MVGNYMDSSGSHGTLYDSSTWTTLDYPRVINTYLSGIDGANMVGFSTEWSGDHGFMVTASGGGGGGGRPRTSSHAFSPLGSGALAAKKATVGNRWAAIVASLNVNRCCDSQCFTMR